MNIKTIFLISVGCLFLLVGLIGVFIPVWPTTPFVLLAFGCFSCAPKLQSKIMGVRLFREYVESYRNRAGLSGFTVASSLIFLFLSLGISVSLVSVVWIRVLLVLIGIAVTVHILWMSRKRMNRKLLQQEEAGCTQSSEVSS